MNLIRTAKNPCWNCDRTPFHGHCAACNNKQEIPTPAVPTKPTAVKKRSGRG